MPFPRREVGKLFTEKNLEFLAMIYYLTVIAVGLKLFLSCLITPWAAINSDRLDTCSK